YGTVNNPGPVTSYTTVRIDGRDYVFGGATQRRAGRLGLYSDTIVGPFIHEGRAIHTVWRAEDIGVTQVLSIARGIRPGSPTRRGLSTASPIKAPRPAPWACGSCWTPFWAATTARLSR